MASSNLTYEDIEHLVDIEIQAAEEYKLTRSDKREKSWDRYYGRPLGNEVKGRSKFITRDMMDTIEWMMPYFIRTFVAGDPKIEIEIKGQESWVGKALMDRIQIDLGEGTPNLFLIFYQWFKDALVSDTAFVKMAWDLDQEDVSTEFDELPPELLQQLVSDPDVTITNGGEMSMGSGGISFKNIKAKIKKTIKDSIYSENIPHWEFLVSPKCRGVNDEYGKGHKTEVTVDYLKRINRAFTEGKKPYFKNLDKLESGQSKSETDINNSEKTSYMSDADQINIDDSTEKGAKSPVTFIEWYTRIDVDDNGYLENIVCYMGNGHLLRWEEDKDGFIPFAALSPIIDCYKFFGISYADLLIEIQNLKTMLFRRILDNFDFQNSGRWLKDPNSAIDTHALLNNIPGCVITGKVDGLKDISPQPFNPVSLSILEYVDTIKENRTGITKYNQGQDSDSLNKTARGIITIQNAAMQRLELIGRLFAELGLKDYYRKVAMLYQKHMRQPFQAKVLGQDREITPDMIQGRVITRVNMGVAASVGAEEAQKIEHMLGVLFKLNQYFPGLLTPEKIHNLSKRYITSLGFKDADDFIEDAQSYLQKAQQQQKEQSEMQQMMMELQKKFKEMELQIKAQDVQVKSQKVQQDGQIATAKLKQEGEIATAEIQSELAIARADVAQKERDSRLDHKLGLLELLADKQNPETKKTEDEK